MHSDTPQILQKKPGEPGGEKARELAELIETQGQNRCAICWWPLSESMEKGCVRGNCSMRGGSEHEQRVRDVARQRIKKNAEFVAGALAACALEARNEALEEAAHLCERDLTNEEDAEWNDFEGGFELWLAKRLRALERAAEGK